MSNVNIDSVCFCGSEFTMLVTQEQGDSSQVCSLSHHGKAETRLSCLPRPREGASGQLSWCMELSPGQVTPLVASTQMNWDLSYITQKAFRTEGPYDLIRWVAGCFGSVNRGLPTVSGRDSRCLASSWISIPFHSLVSYLGFDFTGKTHQVRRTMFFL